MNFDSFIFVMIRVHRRADDIPASGKDGRHANRHRDGQVETHIMSNTSLEHKMHIGAYLNNRLHVSVF